MKRKLFEVDERGIVSELSTFSCGIAPCGGTLVAATDRNEAANLFQEYRIGNIQKATAYNVDGFDYPIKNCVVKIGV